MSRTTDNYMKLVSLKLNFFAKFKISLIHILKVKYNISNTNSRDPRTLNLTTRLHEELSSLYDYILKYVTPITKKHNFYMPKVP
jgi:hypothetical protein